MRTTQCQRIIDYMHKYGSISTLDAFNIGIARLASRIHDLKSQGYAITSYIKTSKNRFGENTYYKVYELAEKEEKEK